VGHLGSPVMQPDPAEFFQATNTAIIRLAVESFTSAPGLTATQKQQRSEAVVCGIMAFLPSEPVQTMLASQAMGHHLLFLDTFQEIFNRGVTENASARLRSAAAICTRSTLSLLREMRLVKTQHLAGLRAEQALADAHAAREKAADDARAAREAQAAADELAAAAATAPTVEPECATPDVEPSSSRTATPEREISLPESTAAPAVEATVPAADIPPVQPASVSPKVSPALAVWPGAVNDIASADEAGEWESPGTLTLEQMKADVARITAWAEAD
jgi:hypothetical protein